VQVKVVVAKVAAVKVLLAKTAKDKVPGLTTIANKERNASRK